MGTAYTVCDDSASVYHPDAGMVKKRNPPDDAHGSQAVVQYDGVHIFAHAENSLITHKRNHCAYLPHRKRMISCLL